MLADDVEFPPDEQAAVSARQLPAGDVAASVLGADGKEIPLDGKEGAAGKVGKGQPGKLNSVLSSSEEGAGARQRQSRDRPRRPHPVVPTTANAVFNAERATGVTFKMWLVARCDVGQRVGCDGTNTRQVLFFGVPL